MDAGNVVVTYAPTTIGAGNYTFPDNVLWKEGPAYLLGVITMIMTFAMVRRDEIPALLPITRTLCPDNFTSFYLNSLNNPHHFQLLGNGLVISILVLRKSVRSPSNIIIG